MRRYDVILFDMDGTLIDSRDAILNSLQYAYKTVCKKDIPYELLRNRIGAPFLSTAAAFGVDAAQGRLVYEAFCEHYEAVGLEKSIPAPHIDTLLKGLKEAGCKLAIASSKPEAYCVKLAEMFEQTGWWDAISGSHDADSEDKPAVMREALRRLDVVNPGSRALMVGDRWYDVKGAAALGMDCYGFNGFGYTEDAELWEAGAKKVFHDYVSMLAELVY